MANKRTGIVHIDKKMCKGCGICVYFCPTKTLAMQEFKAEVVLPESCTGCMMCEMRCPDFAIEVTVVDAEKVKS